MVKGLDTFQKYFADYEAVAYTDLTLPPNREV